MIDVKSVANTIIDNIQNDNLIFSDGGLAVITIGNDAASASYVKGKRADSEKCGFQFRQYAFSSNTPEATIGQTIRLLNCDKAITGIIVQLPVSNTFMHLPELIDPTKDVDGFKSNSPFLPCTPEGVCLLLRLAFDTLNADKPFAGKHIVVIGRGKLVGEPLSTMLLNDDATVTICHSQTRNLAELTKTADAVVSAVGSRLELTSKDFKNDAVLIDCGIHVDENGKIGGDFAPNLVINQTPVPGGVGLMTRAVLMAHVARYHDVRGLVT